MKLSKPTFKSRYGENVKCKKVKKIDEYLENNIFSSNIQIFILTDESCGCGL